MDGIMSLRPRSCYLRLLDIDNSNERAMVLAWLRPESVNKWLDFGDGRNTLTDGQLTFMARNPANRLMLFLDTPSGTPIGLIALQGLKHAARTGMQWGTRGNMNAGARMVTVDAIKCLLEFAFGTLGLATVQAWCVESNRASILVTTRAGFREMGRQRRAHLINGVLHDRILFDVTVEEFAAREHLRSDTHAVPA